MTANLYKRLPFVLLVLMTLILDRWTKVIIDSRFHPNQSVSIVDGLFNITYVQNTGVAFGMFSSLSLSFKSGLLSLFTIGAVALVVFYSLRSPVQNRLLQVALSLILGGALGNLYDRINYGYVIDFLEFYFRSYYWPSFNVADSAITTGVVLIALEMFRNEAPSPA